MVYSTVESSTSRRLLNDENQDKDMKDTTEEEEDNEEDINMDENETEEKQKMRVDTILEKWEDDRGWRNWIQTRWPKKWKDWKESSRDTMYQ